MNHTTLPPDGSPTDLPEKGVRNTSYKAERLHRQDDEYVEPMPACSQSEREADFREISLRPLLAFDRWDLCGCCFPDGGEGVE